MDPTDANAPRAFAGDNIDKAASRESRDAAFHTTDKAFQPFAVRIAGLFFHFNGSQFAIDPFMNGCHDLVPLHIIFSLFLPN